jgi:hypothetical protein
MKEPDSFERKKLLKQNLRESLFYIIVSRYNDLLYLIVDTYFAFLAQNNGKA